MPLSSATTTAQRLSDEQASAVVVLFATSVGAAGAGLLATMAGAAARRLTAGRGLVPGEHDADTFGGATLSVGLVVGVPVGFLGCFVGLLYDAAALWQLLAAIALVAAATGYAVAEVEPPPTNAAASPKDK